MERQTIAVGQLAKRTQTQAHELEIEIICNSDGAVVLFSPLFHLLQMTVFHSFRCFFVLHLSFGLLDRTNGFCAGRTSEQIRLLCVARLAASTCRTANRSRVVASFCEPTQVMTKSGRQTTNLGTVFERASVLFCRVLSCPVLFCLVRFDPLFRLLLLLLVLRLLLLSPLTRLRSSTKA